MPELPEVETVVRDLRPRLVGARIVGAEVAWRRTLRDEDPAAFERAVVGRTITAVDRRGKLVIVVLDGGAALSIHLKMTGQLFVGGPPSATDPYVRLTVRLADGRLFVFRDIRKFGRVGIHRLDPATGDLVVEGPVLGSLGPEPLDPSFDVGAFRHRLTARSGRIKPLLLDQSFIAGLGNIYADEVLFEARIHPLRRVTSLRRTDVRRIHDAVRAVLTEAVARRGSSIDDYTAPDGDGAMQERLLVYQRTGLPCIRCGRPVRRIVLGGRATHFCSWCQRLPASDRGAATDALLRTMVRGSRPGVARSTERTRRAAATRRAGARAVVAEVIHGQTADGPP